MRKIVWAFIIIGITVMHAWLAILFYLMVILSPLIIAAFILWLFGIDFGDITIDDKSYDWEDGFFHGWMLNQFWEHHNWN